MSVCEKDGNPLRKLFAMGKRSNALTATLLMWCDECNTIYRLRAEEHFPEEMRVPILEYENVFDLVPQMEMI